MALNQMTAVTGRKINPNLVSIINSQTPYLPALKRQEKEDALAQEELNLRQQEMLTNEQLAREELERNKKQTRRGNAIALANLGLKGGMGLYQYSEPFKNVVDKAVGGASDFIMGNSNIPSGASSYLGDSFDNASDWMSNMGDWSFAPDAVISGASSFLEPMAEATGEAAYGAVSGLSDPLTDVLSGFFGGFNI